MHTKQNKADGYLYEEVRTGTSIDALKKAFIDNLHYIQGRFPEVATPNDNYQALAYTIRDRLLHLWITTAKAYKDTQARTICYLSAEYLFGPHLGNNMMNLGIMDNTRRAMQELGIRPRKRWLGATRSLLHGLHGSTAGPCHWLWNSL